jgi:hypothetical protein
MIKGKERDSPELFIVSDKEGKGNGDRANKREAMGNIRESGWEGFFIFYD